MEKKLRKNLKNEQRTDASQIVKEKVQHLLLNVVLAKSIYNSFVIYPPPKKKKKKMFFGVFLYF